MLDNNYSQQAKRKGIANLIVGAALLIIGILSITMNWHFIPNHKAIIGLSFIPFAMAFSQWINWYMTKKYPIEMRPVIVSVNDERLVNERNKAEAQSNRIIRWLLLLGFLCYTLMYPNDVFNAFGWWAILILLAMSYFLPLIMLSRVSKSPLEDPPVD